MYTLCEDAAEYGPEKRAEGSGVYFRAVWQTDLTVSDRVERAEHTRSGANLKRSDGFRNACWPNLTTAG